MTNTDTIRLEFIVFHTQDEVHAQLILVGIDPVVEGHHPIELRCSAGRFVLSINGIGPIGRKGAQPQRNNHGQRRQKGYQNGDDLTADMLRTLGAPFL
ncbi:hypothetical protein [Bifidobacterium mizhiense]|uniref:hypothetical protein n=1 Tax=Bifidobacterium mizhiense TaxID=2879940 RepID=UPI001E5F8045|nr:hypothetical protein [Bifidobacterium mizhiense]